MKHLVTYKYNYILLLIAGTLFLTASLYAEEETHKTSINSHFQVSYKSKQEPIPLNQIHQWVLHVKNNDGQAVENAMLSIDGGMPAHNHGLPTQPLATEIGNGDYLIEGMKFSMTGTWEMWIQIQTESVTDKVKFMLEF